MTTPLADRLTSRWRLAYASPSLDRVRIEPGDARDYDALAAHHYRAGPPATTCEIRRAVLDDELVGVLVIAFPTLNATWRDAAWPEFTKDAPPASDRRERAQYLNAHLRTIARVIVEPRHRGMGIARRLVASYLDHPVTPLTEAIASMGAFCPFFERAGMREIHRPPTKASVRLAQRLDDLGVKPWTLADPARRSRALARPAILEAIRDWALAHRSFTRLAREPSAPLDDIALKAVSAIVAPARVYVSP
ncbi:MAG: GNAT family N-acetyltransferase [Phycisphaerales bacterium]|nr:MAG: GNAT family N-acetyltransferase [Phycisphaerales bacterium]